VISVVIPTLRRAQLLSRAIRSVLAQTIHDLELVVVVDGVDGDTTRLLASIQDPRLRFIQNPRSLGSAEARNVGIKKATGEWIAFLDDDDEWEKDKLEKQILAAGQIEGAVIVSCLSRVVTALREYIWPNRIYDNLVPLDEYLFDRRSLFRGDAMLQCSSLLMKRELCADLLFTPEHDDWDLLLRAVKRKGAKIITVKEALVVHYIEDGRSSLGSTFDWRKSLSWARRSRHLIGRRAYAGFCLTIIAPQAAKRREVFAFFALLYQALRYGAPRLIHLALYLVIWLVPMTLRQNVRSRVIPQQNGKRGYSTAL
jgi:glycosyltransferase involved in cell wall biosynthesis